MRLLLDTHVILWSQLEPARLGSKLRAAIDDLSNYELSYSPLSLWEIDLLLRKGRLESEMPFRQWAMYIDQRLGMTEAPLTSAVVRQAAEMEFDHRDPVDRFLAATARCGHMTLVSADRRLTARTDIAVWPVE